MPRTLFWKAWVTCLLLTLCCLSPLHPQNRLSQHEVLPTAAAAGHAARLPAGALEGICRWVCLAVDFATHLEPDAHGKENGDVWLSATHGATPEEFVRQCK